MFRRNGLGLCGNVGCSGVERSVDDSDAKWDEEYVIVRYAFNKKDVYATNPLYLKTPGGLLR